MNKQLITEYLLLAYKLYESNGVLLDNDSLLLIEQLDKSTLSKEFLDFIDISRNKIQETLDLNLKVLEDAENAKNIAIAKKEEIEKLNVIANKNLVEEKKLRIADNKAEFQRKFAIWIIFLIATIFIFMFFGSIFLAETAPFYEIASNTLSSLLIILSAAGTYLFAQKEKE